MYENVFKAKQTLYSRTFNPETKESMIEAVHHVPSLFIPVKEKTEFKSFHSEKYLKRIDFPSKKEYKQTKEMYESTGIELFGQSNETLSYIQSNYPNPIESYHSVKTWYLDIEVTETETEKSDSPTGWKPDECSLPVTLIQIYDSFSKEFYILGLKDWEKENEFSSPHGKVNYWKMSSEENLLKGFIKILNSRKPTVIIGFNSRAYDYPYLTQRISKVLDSNNVKEEGKHNPDIIKGSYTRQLSPVDVVEFDFNEDKQNPTRSFMSYEWKGIFLEDFRELYQKYTFTTLPSYSLESVASFELGEGKISHDSFVSFGALYLGSPEDYRYSSKNKEEWCLLDTLKEKISNGEDVLEEFKKESYNLFVTYGIKDIELLIELEEKLKLYPLAQLIAYTTGCNTDDVKGTLKQWQSFVFNEGFKRELILPLKSPFKQGTDTQFVGGWTHASRKFSKWVSSLDYTSLYPSIMMWSNMGSDTLVEYKDLPKEVKDIKEKYFIHYSKDIPKEEFPSIEANFINDVLRNPEVREEIHSVLSKYNLSATPNGSFFKKEVRSVLSELIEQMMVDRKIAKKEMKKAETRIEELKKLLYNLESSEK